MREVGRKMRFNSISQVFLAVCIVSLVLTATTQATLNKLYWADLVDDSINRANLDGTERERLVTGLSQPHNVSLDISAGKMYWGDQATQKIQRSNLDGSGIETVLDSDVAKKVRQVELDTVSGQMYWASIDDKIWRADLDGTNIESLVSVSNPVGLALDLTNEKIYWTDNDTKKLYWSNLDGSNQQVLASLQGPSYLAIDEVYGFLYRTELGSIIVSDLDGTNSTTLLLGLDSPSGIALDLFNEKMYWTDLGANKIQCANLDGSGLHDIITNDLPNPIGITLTVAPEPSTLTMRTEPNEVNSVTPSVGDHNYAGLVDIMAEQFVNCPNVYVFDHWEGDVLEPNSANTAVFINSDKVVTAVFAVTRQCGDECHPYPPGDLSRDCLVNQVDVNIFKSRVAQMRQTIIDHWLECTRPECD